MFAAILDCDTSFPDIFHFGNQKLREVWKSKQDGCPSEGLAAQCRRKFG